MGVVDGLNHYGWTDAATPGELVGDGVATRAVDDARRDLLPVLDRWIDAIHAQDEAALEALPTLDAPGVDFEAP